MSLDDLLKELDEIDDGKNPPPPPPPPPKVEKKSRSKQKPKPRVKTVVKKEEFKVPDFNTFLKFCEKHYKDDYEIEQFYKHTAPRAIHLNTFGFPRGGGGWSGAVKATINIMRKMKEKGVL